MDKEQLNAKIKETKENLGKAFSNQNVKENFKKVEGNVKKAVDEAVNSDLAKKMSSGQKYATLGITAFIFIVIIALISRFVFTPAPSIWCVADAPKSELEFNVPGNVAEVAYSEKQTVPKGNIIARLHDEAFTAELESAEVLLMEVNLKLLKMESYLSDIENALAESRLKIAENMNEAAIIAFDLAKEYEKQYRSFFENKMILEAHYLTSLKDVENAEAEMKRTENELEKAKQYFKTMNKGYTPEEITSTKQEAVEAAKRVVNARAMLTETSIIAPFDAYINKIKVKAGDSIEPGVPVCEVIDLSRVWLRGFVNRAMAESLSPGHVVNVEFDEIPKETFTGKIVSVASEPEQIKGEDQYELRMELDNPGGNVLPEMKAIAIVVHK